MDEAVRAEAVMVTVVGTGGSGATTTAVALARALGRRRPTVLVDLTRQGDVALALGLDPHRPGLAEVLAGRRPAPTAVVGRGLQVVTGLRHPADWTTIGDPSAVDAALTALREVADHLVCDAGGDLEGHEHTGSLDVEDRHRLARTAVAYADVVVVASRPSAGHRARRRHLADELRTLGVDPARTVLSVRSRRGIGPVAARRLARRVTAVASTLPPPARRSEPDPVVPGTLGFASDRRRWPGR